jgi:hypothetical protein
MNRRWICVILCILLLCTGQVSTAVSSAGQKPPKPEYNIEKILSSSTITTEVRQRLLENAGLGMNRILWNSGKWEEKASLDEIPFRNLDTNERLPTEVIQVYITQAVVSREIAIEKLREENKDG